MKEELKIAQKLYELFGEVCIGGSYAINNFITLRNKKSVIAEPSSILPRPRDMDVYITNPSMTTEALLISIEAWLTTSLRKAVTIKASSQGHKYHMPGIRRRFHLTVDGMPLPYDLIFVTLEADTFPALIDYLEYYCACPLATFALKNITFSPITPKTLTYAGLRRVIDNKGEIVGATEEQIGKSALRVSQCLNYLRN